MTSSGAARLRVTVRGAVQGVGFRPFVFRLAQELGLRGWVKNSPQGVFIEAEGPAASLQRFLQRLQNEKPPRSSIQSLESSWLDPAGCEIFEVRPSDSAGPKTALVLPDIATCPDCLAEIFDPSNRRFFYPFTNCTNCGPRFSIIERLPYDRANTSMKTFAMCEQCQGEYEAPADRRFHAQPNACPICGPHLELWDENGRALKSSRVASEEASGSRSAAGGSRAVLAAAVQSLSAGKILALKGLGGFHLLVDAHNDGAVARLRERKHREQKPFALMLPSLEAIEAVCEISEAEASLLKAPEAPIVLLRRRAPPLQPEFNISAAIAPGNPNLGVMLPYTPLHHLLLSLFGRALVATSGNISDEPICIDEQEALVRLRGIADFYLVHNRPIVRHVDDSIARVIAGREQLLRRARGYAPLPLSIAGVPEHSPAILAVGAHLKNTVTLAIGGQAFISQHIGDLETEAAYGAFTNVVADFERLYETRPEIIAADAHSEYLSTKFAAQVIATRAAVSRSSEPGRFLPVQHHLAHVYSCMAENDLRPPVLGVSWDGTGYGLDRTVWGGEFFLVKENSVQRVAHLRPFRLPGGELAVKEPRRSALGLLFELHGDDGLPLASCLMPGAFADSEVKALGAMLERGMNSPMTSSVGRLFDAVAALLNVRRRVWFEGQAAMELEFAAETCRGEQSYSFGLKEVISEPSDMLTAKSCLALDWGPLIEGMLEDRKGGASTRTIAAKFHHGLIQIIVEVAKRVGVQSIALSGGCFQNRYLTEGSIEQLRAHGFRPYWHQRVPPNDGGISLGQVVAALRTWTAQKVD